MSWPKLLKCGSLVNLIATFDSIRNNLRVLKDRMHAYPTKDAREDASRLRRVRDKRDVKTRHKLDCVTTVFNFNKRVSAFKQEE